MATAALDPQGPYQMYLEAVKRYKHECLAATLLRAAEEVEPIVTAALQEMASSHAGELVGLEHRLKQKQSLALKLQEFAQKHIAKAALKEGKVVTDAEAVAVVWRRHVNHADGAGPSCLVPDTLRYTVRLPHASYTTAVAAMRGSLAALGHTLMEQRNFWGEPCGYRGVNDVYGVPTSALPCGRISYELQFHTADTMALRAQTHELFEVFQDRAPDGVPRSVDERVEANEEMCRLAAALSIPEGADALPTRLGRSMMTREQIAAAPSRTGHAAPTT